MNKISIILFIVWMQLGSGFYIKSASEHSRGVRNKPALTDTVSTESDWNTFKQKLGLSNEKIEMLKQQKDQPATVELLKRFIKENPKYSIDSKENDEKPNPLFKLFRSLLKNHKISKSTLKTTLNFVLGDRSKKSQKRPRRKIALNMVSDMPNEKIDDLIKMFTTQYGIDDSDLQTDDGEDYNEVILPALLPQVMNHDYMYENLYEDEEDLGIPAKTHLNSEYGSFQDLILQASRNQWQREMEETKLRNQNNEKFI